MSGQDVREWKGAPSLPTKTRSTAQHKTTGDKEWGWRKTAFRALRIRSPKRWLEPGGAASEKAVHKQAASSTAVAALPLWGICGQRCCERFLNEA
jgi:hypothetical protein